MRIQNRSHFRTTKCNYRIENKAKESTVYLYDEISFWGISADRFVEDFNKIDSPVINLRINSMISPGKTYLKREI